MKISTKMTIFTNLFLVISFSALFIINAKQSRDAAFDAQIDKARKIVTMAEGIREYSGSLIHNDFYKMDELKKDAKKFVQIIPVVTAMRVAEDKAKLTGMEFKVPKMSPRNPKNMPDEIDMQALETMKKADNRTGDTPEYVVYDKSGGYIRYYKAVRLSKECEWCHGDPATSEKLWGNSQGLDPTGVKMENWRAGEIHGAFEFKIPIAPINAYIRKGLIIDIVALVVILVILSTTTMFIAKKLIFNRLEVVGRRLKNIATGNGDLTKFMEGEGSDELGVISTNFNMFIRYIREIVIDVQENAQYMHESSSALKNTVQEISRGMETQKEDTGNLASAVEEIRANIDSIADNSVQTSQKALETQYAATKGNTAVEDMINKMHELSITIHESSRMVEDLKLSSDRIGDIIAVINDIADQTNLLALNASIEAARAGEQGRGFAVVADEVRKLAERTQTATKEISAMITSLQRDSKNAAENIINSVSKVEQGGEVASVAGEALKVIIADSSESAEMVKTIQSATSEQAKAVSSMSENTDQINGVADINWRLLNDISKAADSLNSMASELSSKVQSFKTK